MTEFTTRFWDVFFEVFEELPRQGPGNRECAKRALSACRGLPPEPDVLDLGCGLGGQTLILSELLAGRIFAVDIHRPWIERLRKVVEERGLSHRVTPMVADMGELAFEPESFDLIWSEGAIYFIGVTKALQVCAPLLRPGGYVAFTEPVWRRPDPPEEIKKTFEFDYPEMGQVQSVLEAIDAARFDVVDRFTLPDEAWWDDFYTPMDRRIAELRPHYEGDAEALEVLEQLAREPRLHEQYSGYYAYEFFVVRPRGGAG